MPVTLAQIAARANAHPSTVSLVLNSRQYGRVSPETRDRIEAIANELGYRVNRHAQGLARGKTKTVAVLLNQLSNPFFGQYVSLIEAGIEPFGYHVMPFETRADVTRERELMTLPRQGICDLVVSLAHYSTKKEGHPKGESIIIRLADFSNQPRLRTPLPHVAIRYRPAMARLFEHLVETGRTRLGLVMHRNNEPFPRHDGESPFATCLRELLKESRLVCDESCQAVAHESDSLQVWHDAAYNLLSMDPKIDAFLVHSTEFIAPVIAAARKLGRSVGHDLALATFDDPPFAAWIEGGVTVVREPIPRVAEALAAQVVSVLSGKGTLPSKKFDAELVIRESTRSQ